MATMTVKNGVKNWGDSVGTGMTPTSKTSNISAVDKAKLGDEDLGALLNKVADPNWVDPSKKLRTTGDPNLDKDAFMKLMLAQMKNQDPMNPMKSHEMAAQLAQFSGVEQMSNINSTLAEMRDAQKPSANFQALSFIGKSVSGDSSKIVRAKGDTTHDFTFSIPENAKEVKIKVRNSNGDIVREATVNGAKQGSNSWVWNGLAENGKATNAGEYQVLVEATTEAGKKLNVKTDFEGQITGVNYTAEGPVLLVGTQAVKLKDVKKIVDPSLKINDQISKTNVAPDLKNQPQASQTENKQELPKAGEEEPVPGSALMDSVGMSRELLSKVDKETKPDGGAKPAGKSERN